MSKLTEKLGIKPIEEVELWVKKGRWCAASKVRKVEQQRNDLLKISITMIFDRGDWLEYYPEEIKIIEGIAKMELEEIKQLIGE